MNPRIPLILLALSLTGCATSTKQVTDRSEYLVLTESREEAERYWSRSKAKAPEFPRSAGINKIAGCSRFKITINSEGETVEAELLDSYPADVFNASSLEAISQWTWKPTQENRERIGIERLVQLDFYMADAKNLQEASRYCAVANMYKKHG